MMFGCSSLAEVRASRWKRSTNSLSKASENGRTLMATSRSSWRSRALKTIAMPPRPSSSTMSCSSFSSWRTRSTSETSDSPLSGVAARSRPQDRQNLLASSFWVPQREQYIRTPTESAKLRGGRDEVSTTALPRDDREALVPRERDAAGGVADAHTQDVFAARDIAQLQPPGYACDRPIARGIEPEHPPRAPAATAHRGAGRPASRAGGGCGEPPAGGPTAGGRVRYSPAPGGSRAANRRVVRRRPTRRRGRWVTGNRNDTGSPRRRPAVSGGSRCDGIANT